MSEPSDSPQQDAASQALVCHFCGFRPTGDERACPEDGAWLITQEAHDAHPTDPFLGRVMAGKYPIVGVLGAGGMGSVYRAIQQPVGRPVALKVIRYTGDDADTVQQRFAHEASIVAQLSHPNTVTLYDFGVNKDGTLYMVLELVSGHPLTREIKAGALEIERACSVVGAALDALIEAHHVGLVHRDLKPDNIMLAATTWGGDAVKVLDFGIAKVLGGDEDATSQLTQTGMVFGTPRYMAPEQARAKTIDHRADLYAMGVILYECVTGSVPFDADNTFDILLAQLQQEPPDIEDPRVPEQVKAVLKKSMAKKVEERYQTAAEMAEAIRTAAGLPVRTTSASMPAMAEGRALLAESDPEPIRPSGSLSAANPNMLSGGFGNPLASPLGMGAADAGPPIGQMPQRPHTPGGGTSQILSAEMVAYQVKKQGRGRLGAAIAVATLVLGGAGVWWATQRGGPGPGSASSAATGPDGQPVAPAEPQATPREKADKLLGEGLRLVKSGNGDAALAKLRAASAADPTYGEPHLHQAALHARSKAGFKAIGSLEAFLGIEDDPDAVAGRIAADGDFAALIGDKDFTGWLHKKGLRSGPPAALAAPPQAAAKKGKKKRRRKKQALEVPEF